MFSYQKDHDFVLLTILYFFFFFFVGLMPKDTFIYLFKIRLDIVSSWFSEEGPTALKISFSLLVVRCVSYFEMVKCLTSEIAGNS